MEHQLHLKGTKAAGKTEPGVPAYQTKGAREPMPTGTVKWFHNEKGYGFITPDGGGADLFLHQSNIDKKALKSIQDGRRVQYEPAQGKNGPEATKVTLSS